jgi:hypothetical protein
MPEKAIAGNRLTIEQVPIVIDVKIEEGNSKITNGINGYIAYSIWHRK